MATFFGCFYYFLSCRIKDTASSRALWWEYFDFLILTLHQLYIYRRSLLGTLLVFVFQPSLQTHTEPTRRPWWQLSGTCPSKNIHSTLTLPFQLAVHLRWGVLFLAAGRKSVWSLVSLTNTYRTRNASFRLVSALNYTWYVRLFSIIFAPWRITK